MYVIQLYRLAVPSAGDMEPVSGSQIPLSWYEHTWLYAGVGILGGLALQLLFWQLWGYVPPVWLSSLAVLCYVAGFLFDVGATHLHVRQKRAFEKRGLRMPTCEANPLLPAYPTLAQQIWNIATLLSLLYILVVAAMPGVGFGATSLHGLAGLGNYRVYRRSLLTLKMFDARRQRGWPGDRGAKKGIERQAN